MTLHCQVGFNEALSVLELSRVFDQKPLEVGHHLYSINIEGLSRFNHLANRLGGTIDILDPQAGKVIWRHSAKYWFKHDRGKPFASGRKGLLPPKIARILINLGTGGEELEGKNFLDPFCGSGTLLAEAGYLGMNLYGADNDQAQLTGAQSNLNFFDLHGTLIHADSVKLSEFIKVPIHFLATEPYMGKPNPDPARTKDLAKGLMKLYLGALKDWQKFLVSGAKVSMIFPVFSVAGQDFHTSQIIDDKALSSYNTSTRGLIYSKPEAIVRREIVVLTKI